MLTPLAFLLALALLIAVHEYGHYRIAVACGVKVLRFSVGFGRPLWRWQASPTSTEFVIGMFPLGGYVRMLDEREGPVADGELHLAFNRQPLRLRAAIVAAGPAANLILAVALYAVVNWSGLQQAQAILASPGPGSVAEAAGIRGGEKVSEVAIGEADSVPVRSFEDLRWVLLQAALKGERVRLTVEGSPGRSGQTLVLDMSGVDAREPDAQLLRQIGLPGPWTSPMLGEVVAGGAAQRAGLQEGDLVLQIGSQAVSDGMQLRELIRNSVRDNQGFGQVWKIERGGKHLLLEVTPEVRQDAELLAGRIGAYVGAPPAMVTVRYGPFEGLWHGVVRTWDVSMMTLRMMGRMIVGEASLKNLSGPLTIADYAGRSAQLGVTQYLIFLALISVSLGILNLLPLPVLDGGHLMYYLWEGITGRVISDVWMDRMQRGGVAVLFLMMSIALYNDITRLIG